MFDEDRHFNFFDYESLSKDFCYSKPLSMHFKTGNQTTSSKFDQQIQFKNSRCTLNHSISLNHKIDASNRFKITTTMNNLRLYYARFAPASPIIPQNTANEQSNSQPVPPQYDYTYYGSAFFDRKLQNAVGQVGIEQRNDNTFLNANITGFLYEHKIQYFIYTKMLYMSQKFNLGFLSVFDTSCRNLQTNNLVFQYNPHPKHQIFLRGEVDGLRNYMLNLRQPRGYFDRLAANYLFRPTDSLTLMGQIGYDPSANAIKLFETIIQKRFPTRKLKLRLNQLGDMAVQVGLPVGEGSIEFGLLLADILHARRISYGFRLNLNSQ